jgi:hypothetical protein
MAIAIFDSVTVSIADEIKGTFKLIKLDSLIFKLVCEGTIDEYFGSNKTSSNVRASLIGSI